MALPKGTRPSREKLIASRATEIAWLRDEARKLLDRQPEARRRADEARDDAERVYAAAQVRVTDRTLAARLREVYDDALARYLAARHQVRAVRDHDDAIVRVGVASPWNGFDVARAVLDRPDASTDELRDHDTRRAVKRARKRHRFATSTAIERTRAALAVIDDPSADPTALDAELRIGWQTRCSWGAAYLGNERGYPRCANADHSMLLAADAVYRALSNEQMRTMLVFALAVAIAHVEPEPETTERVLAVAKDVSDDVLARVAPTVAEVVQLVIAGDGATYAVASHRARRHAREERDHRRNVGVRGRRWLLCHWLLCRWLLRRWLLRRSPGRRCLFRRHPPSNLLHQ